MIFGANFECRTVRYKKGHIMRTWDYKVREGMC